MDLSKYATNLTALHEKTVWLFKKQSVASDYIGDAYAWQHGGSISCSVLPVTDKLTIETYGPRVQQMLALHASPDVAISDGMGVSLTDSEEPEYIVVTTHKRTMYVYALIEVIDIGSQG
jgi:hypothetical protein